MKSFGLISKLFASDDWRLIRKRLEEFFQRKIVINPLFDENALISIDQGSIINFIREEGKWQACGNFHLKFERWDNIKHSRPLVLKGYDGWLKIKDLSRLLV